MAPFAIIVLYFGRDLHLKKPVVAIKVLYRLHVARQDGLAEQAIQQQPPGRLHYHLLTQVFLAEIVITLEHQVRQLVALVPRNMEDHIAPLRTGVLFLLICHLHVKKALALKIVTNIVRTFI